MGETLDALLTVEGGSALTLVDSLDNDVRSTLSVIAYTNKWDYNFVKERQRWLKQEYAQKIEQSALFQGSFGVEPLWWLCEAYRLFLELDPSKFESKARIQRECQELLGSLHYSGCISLYEQENEENIA